MYVCAFMNIYMSMYVTHAYTHMATVLHISADNIYIVVYINKLLIMSFT